MHSVSWCFLNAERTLSTNYALQRASRACERHISKIKCRLVYARRYIFEEMCVPFAPKCYFGQRATPSRIGMDDATMVKAFGKVVSRARPAHTFKTNCPLQREMRVSSTRHAYLPNQILFRLRETISFLRSSCKTASFEAQLSRASQAEPNRIEPSRPEPCHAKLGSSRLGSARLDSARLGSPSNCELDVPPCKGLCSHQNITGIEEIIPSVPQRAPNHSVIKRGSPPQVGAVLQDLMFGPR